MSEPSPATPPSSATLPLLVLAALLLLANGLGAFDAADELLLGQIARLHADPPRDLVPVFVDVDGRSTERFGPLPWSASTWAGITARLGQGGVVEAWLVDPWPRLLRPEDADPAPTVGTRVLVPTLVLGGQRADDGGVALRPPASPRGGFVATPATLALPLRSGGVLRDLGGDAGRPGPAGPSVFCRWLGACPTGEPMALPITAPRRRSSLATISLVDALDAAGSAGLGDLDDRLILLGTTDAAMGELLRVGPRAMPLPRAEAIAWAVATARDRAPTPRGSRAFGSLAVLLMLLVAAASRRLLGMLRSEVELLVLVAAAAAGVLASTLSGLFAPPPTAVLLAAAAPGVVSLATSRMRTLWTLRRMAFLLVHDSLRSGWRESVVREPRDLLLTLASLGRTHFPRADIACFYRAGLGPELELLGSFGGRSLRLVAEAPALDREPFLAAAGLELGGEAAGLFEGVGDGRLLPLRSGGELIGFWGVFPPPGEAPPDPTILRRLLRWAERQLALPRPGRWRRLRARFSDLLEEETAEISRVFQAAMEERHRQVQTLVGIDLPLFAADLAGAIVFVNRAQAAVLDRLNLPTPRSVRALLARLVDERELDEIARSTAARGQILRRTGTTPAGQPWELLLQPLSGERRAEDDDLSLPGFVGSLRPRTEAVRMDSMREAIIHFGSGRVRNALTVITGYTDLLGTMLTDPAQQELQQAILHSAAQVSEAVDAIGGVLNLETASELHVSVDLVRLSSQAIEDLEGVASGRGVDLRLHRPEFSLPVMADPRRTDDALRLLLAEAIAGAHPGTAVEIDLSQEHDTSRISLSWRGPGYDPALVKAINAPQPPPPESLPEGARRLALARATFTDLHLISEPGQGGTVTVTLLRTERTGSSR